jgi:DNA-binding CsgD family transcriptional regulator/acid stress-induced BolA-like protein IbaG/YrbA
LEHAFASRAAELPSATRTLLHIAAVDDAGVLSEVLSAAEIVGGAGETVQALIPALEAQLVEVEGSTVRFRHPLIRSAIRQAASVYELQAVHAALAEVLASDPDRRVWHQAAAASGVDPAVASHLEEAAERAQRRGATALAVAAFERSAALTAERDRRGALLLRAAEAASELGRSDVVTRLARQADSLELGSHDRARSMWLGEVFAQGVAGEPTRTHALVQTAERMMADGAADLTLNLLLAAAFRCYWVDPGEQSRREVLAAADRAGDSSEDPRLILIQAYAAPVERASVVIDRVRSVMPEAEADASHLLGTAAQAVGAFDLSSSLLARSVERLREQGRLGVLAQVLVSQAWAAISLADWGAAAPAAAEAARLAGETGQPLWEAGAKATLAAVAAFRGEQATVEKLAAEAERVALPGAATAILAAVQLARGWAALGLGRQADAYDELRRLFNPADPAYHHILRFWAIGDLAEAAAHSGRREQACEVVRQLEPMARKTPSPLLHLGLAYAGPLLAAEGEAEPLFQAALATDMTGWPLYWARLQLAWGEWLRRQRRMAESRGPLRAARDAFDALGVVPWSERARQELRASGESSRMRTPDTRDELTPHELQIAQMAAAGLSNREIGQRLYLSHRTVETHLYHLFPKLGVTSRAHLREALLSN